MKPPRALWVPFELGRPFGASNQPEFQSRVLQAALKLLERSDGPPILEDFPEEAPETERDSETLWTCLVSFTSDQEVQPEGLLPVLAEIEHLKPWHEVFVSSRGKSTPFVSGLDLSQVVGLLGELAEGNPEPNKGCNLELREAIRLGCDDLRTWYSEAAQGQPGKGNHKQIEEWFWTDTAATRLIAAAAKELQNHPDPFIRLLADRAMVPRIYKKGLFQLLGNKKSETNEGH